jgi:hypothetical protein
MFSIGNRLNAFFASTLSILAVRLLPSLSARKSPLRPRRWSAHPLIQPPQTTQVTSLINALSAYYLNAPPVVIHDVSFSNVKVPLTPLHCNPPTAQLVLLQLLYDQRWHPTSEERTVVALDLKVRRGCCCRLCVAQLV